MLISHFTGEETLGDESFAQSHTAVAVLGPEAPTLRSMRFLWTPASSFKMPEYVLALLGFLFLPKTNVHMALPCLGQESCPRAALGKLKPTAAGIRKNEPGLE